VLSHKRALRPAAVAAGRSAFGTILKPGFNRSQGLPTNDVFLVFKRLRLTRGVHFVMIAAMKIYTQNQSMHAGETQIALPLLVLLLQRENRWCGNQPR
jgi:hypothetical protein